MQGKKTIWITGASSGIGEALTYTYAKKGAKIAISARRADMLKKVKQNCGAAAENVHIVPIDLEKYSEATEWYEMIKAKIGVPDLVINNGGIGHLGAALAMANVVEQKVMDINFWGQVAVSKAVLPDMIACGSGKIVVISSLLGHYGTANLAAYAASKHALLGYFESLRQELTNSGVRFLLVSPGFVNTQVTINSLLPDGEKYQLNSIAQEKGMQPEVFAQKLIKKIDSDQWYAYIGGKELLAIPLKRLAPRFFYWLYGKLAARAKS